MVCGGQGGVGGCWAGTEAWGARECGCRGLNGKVAQPFVDVESDESKDGARGWMFGEWAWRIMRGESPT